MSTRLDLQAMVIENTGRSDKTTLINNSLNFALKELSRLYPFAYNRPEADYSVAAASTYKALAARLNQIVEIRLIDPAVTTFSNPLTIMRKVPFVRMFPNVAGSAITGRPSHVYLDGVTVYFNCITLATYTLRVTYYQLDRFVDDTTVATIPDADEVLVAYATANTYRGLQMYEDAAEWDKMFLRLSRSLINQAEKDIGNQNMAREWTNSDRAPESSGGNPPWLDPWAER